MVRCRVILLNGNDFTCEIDNGHALQVKPSVTLNEKPCFVASKDRQSKGQDLFDKACQHIGLQERDYFGLSFRDNKNLRFWLKNDRKINRQIGSSVWLFSFEVKFYPPDPSMLKEEVTRYQLFLQLRRDLVSAKLPCSFMTYVLLGSYAVQSQCGDYVPHEHGAGTRYIGDMVFAPQQSDELLEKIAELHKTLRGVTPPVAEFHYVQNAAKLALYGVHLHLAKDSSGADVEVGVCSIGLVIYKEHLRVKRFTWPKILSFSYKWNVFIIRIRVGETESGPSHFNYKLTSDKLAKRLWRIAVEHHTFFRLRDAGQPSEGLMAHFSPRYHYSGRTLYQVQQLASSTSVIGTLDRSTTSSVASSRRHVNTSKSLESVLAGYSTERSEMYTPTSKRAATLDLKNRQPKNLMKNAEQTPSPTDGNMLYSTIGNPGWNSNRPPVSPRGNDRDQSPYPNGNTWNQNTGPVYSTPHSQVPPDLRRSLSPYQEDRTAMPHDGRFSGHAMDSVNSWNQSGSSAPRVPPSAFSYLEPRRILVSQFVTLNNGSHSGHYDNRCYDEDIDHDRALTEAILAVTAVNKDLAVEKIEIHTQQ